MSLDGRTRLALEHMLDAITDVRTLLAGKGRADFVAEWHKIAGIGNVLRQDYDEIDAGVVWRTAVVEIEPLAELVKSLLAGLQQDEASTSDRA